MYFLGYKVVPKWVDINSLRPSYRCAKLLCEAKASGVATNAPFALALYKQLIFVHNYFCSSMRPFTLIFVSRESRKSHEIGCIAEGSQLSALPSVCVRMAHTSDSDVCFARFREIRVRQKNVYKD